MPNGKLPTTTLELNVPTYLPLPEAARKYELSEKVLTQLIQAGKIEAVRLPSGEVLVSADNGRPKNKETILDEEFVSLRGRLITVTEGAEKYDLHRNTILEWVRKEYITAKKQGGRGSRMELDEAELAYCAKIYHERKGISGVPLLDENGLPYQLKHPELAKYRRRRRREK
ncbi:MAG: hypothetical protein AB1801_11775 [Chloroflexota bacterium]